MPSRKRAKGRERKLKQQVRESVEQSVSQPRAPLNGGNINLPEQSINRIVEQAEDITCTHGCFITPQEHPVTHFMNSFIESVGRLDCRMSVVLKSLEMTFEKHQEVWKNDAMKKMVIGRIVNMGTDLILDESIEGAKKISQAIVLLEHYDGEGIFPLFMSKGSEEITKILYSRDRDVVHFYKKRIPCSCLDEIYSELKKCQVRGSTCSYCKQTVKRKDLKTCSRCKFAQYCSKECQKLDWPSHKEHCMEFADFHKVANMVETAKSSEGI